ncbi:carboxypeptidase-like regulatory domain-containing protein [Maribacter antarcticus]|uniref:carboxypeptidase-like regulatory domain-containing protein n=1 Tax=Maribacter antarcticus TaxID=505250 RepID=UPI000AA700F1|nr:carboxypeptidase-like regulatory domain-containing protein [Maribacter antarcticus]
MKKNMFLLVCAIVSSVFVWGQDERMISGTVSDGNSPISNVQIAVLENGESVFSNTDGKYTIVADTGDVLTYTYMGMKTITIRVEDVTRILNPIMILDVNELDEVVVESSKRLSQKNIEEQYTVRENIIKTAYGYIDAERSSGRIGFIQEDDITFAAGNILNLIATGRLQGVQIIDGGVFIRGISSIENRRPAVFDVDGQIFTQIPMWVDLGNIKRIAVLNNLAMTTQYGTIASGGVIVINTLAGNIAKKGIVDQAKLRNNFYKDDALDSEGRKNNWPAYKKQLYASTSVETAQITFKELAVTHSNSPYFLLDAQAYFTEEWDRADLGEEIIANHFTPYTENSVLLKALSYQYQEQGQYEKANATYKEVFLLRPNYAQSYLDMARSYREIGSTIKSASLHARYGYLQEQGFMEIDTAGLGSIMDREFNNLLALEKDAVVEKGKRNKLFVAKEDFEGTRVVFEWNDGEAEFELQFVNPGKQYHTWKHSLADNAALIAREKNFGYNTMEQLIDGSLPGNWRVNVTYLGNKSLTPSYLKATVYHNYGTRAQRKEVKVFKMSLKNVNQELLTLRSAMGVASK